MRKCNNVRREMRIRPLSVLLSFPSFDLLSIYFPFPLIRLSSSGPRPVLRMMLRRRPHGAVCSRLLKTMCEVGLSCLVVERTDASELVSQSLVDLQRSSQQLDARLRLFVFTSSGFTASVFFAGLNWFCRSAEERSFWVLGSTSSGSFVLLSGTTKENLPLSPDH